MKLYKANKQSFKRIFISAFFTTTIVFSSSVFATDFDVKTTDNYENWSKLSSEEKQESIMPKTYSAEIPESILREYMLENDIPSLLSDLLGKTKTRLTNVSASFSDEKYSLADNIPLRVEHQGITSECWAFSMLKAVETNMTIKNELEQLPDFSERHMDYATARTFLDGINEKGFKREVGSGGTPVYALAYLTNGQGAVLESEMPFENNEEKINLKEINKTVDTTVTEYLTLPVISKQYQKDEAGNTTSVTYIDAAGNIYNEEQVNAIRQLIKQYIIENGAIPSVTAANHAKYYNYDRNDSEPSVFKSTAYNCNDITKLRDHAITIVGWDDTYSKDNFAEGSKPSTDGAYIVLNTYGEESFDNGYIYISYEDYFIESELYSIVNTSKVNYDNIYQSDFYGGIFSIGTTSQDIGYYANTYKRDVTKTESLNSVGITVADYVELEIFVNAKNENKDMSSLVKVGETKEILEPGYHRIDVTPTKLTGESFAIVVKQKSANGVFYFSVEAPVANTGYELVTSDNNSFCSMDGEEWMNLSEISVGSIDMKKSDVCIKAFTTNEQANDEEDNENNEDEEKISISSEKYLINKQIIYKIEAGTTVEDFLKDITSDNKLSVWDGKNQIKSEEEKSELIKSGMILKVDDKKEFELVVRGDINCDAKISLTDISKLILHYNEAKGFELTGVALKSADMNFDEVVTLTDISQLLILFNNMPEIKK